MAARKRKKRSTSFENAIQLRYNEPACSDKISETGYNFFWGVGLASGLLGPIDVLTGVIPNRPIYIFNSDANVQYVTLGDATIVAPVSCADGIPIPPLTGIVLSSHDNTYIIASDKLVSAYIAEDDVLP